MPHPCEYTYQKQQDTHAHTYPMHVNTHTQKFYIMYTPPWKCHLLLFLWGKPCTTISGSTLVFYTHLSRLSFQTDFWFCLRHVVLVPSCGRGGLFSDICLWCFPMMSYLIVMIRSISCVYIWLRQHFPF